MTSTVPLEALQDPLLWACLSSGERQLAIRQHLVPEPLLADFYGWVMQDTTNAAGITLPEWQLLPKPMRRQLRRRWNRRQRSFWFRHLETRSLTYNLAHHDWAWNLVLGGPMVLALVIWIAILWCHPAFAEFISGLFLFVIVFSPVLLIGISLSILYLRFLGALMNPFNFLR
ncbi:MAG: hypothetical protein ACFE0O_01465 [Opitutales bacterium]